MPDEGLPRLGADTLQARAAASEQIFEARQRARDQVLDQFDTVDDPRDVPIRREGDRFVPGPRFLDDALPREAAADLDPQFPNQDLGPADVRRSPQGFEPREPVRRRSAAFELEDETGLQDIDPFGDLEARDGGGFGLNQGAQRRVAANDLNPQFPDVDIGPSDLTEQNDTFGLNQQTQRRLAANDLNPQFPDVDIGPSDLSRQDDTFGLNQQTERRVAAERLEDQTPLSDVGTGDIRETDDGFRLRDSVIENNIGLFR